MAVRQGYGKIAGTDALVFAYDTGDTRNSYIGEPATNLALFSMNVGFSSDYPSNITFTDDSTVTYQGRQSKKVVATGQWNIYKYPRSGNYTATSSTTFTYSFKIKWANGSTPSFGNGYIYTDAISTYPGITVRAIEDGWFWCYCTYNSTSSPPTLTGFTTSQTGTCWIVDWQLEAGRLYPTPYVAPGGTRSATQGLLDLAGTRTINLSSISFDNNAQPTFDGTNDLIDVSYYSTVSNSLSRSWEVVVRPTTSLTYAGIFGHKLGYGCSYYCNGGIYLWYGNWSFNWYDNAAYQFLDSSVAATANAYAHIVGTYDASDQKPRIYVNGQLRATYGSSTNMNYGGETYVLDIGWNSKDGGQHYLQGQIPVAKYYSNKALTADEVRNNYNQYRSRFNI